MNPPLNSSRNASQGEAIYQLGQVSPVPVNDFIHYQFYRTCPPECLLVCRSFGLEEFSVESVDRSLTGFWAAFDFLVQRRVDRISQIGIPMTACLGRARSLELMGAAQRKTDIPVAADFEESIVALRQLGIRKLAVGAKWDDELMQRVGAYLADAGLDMVGYTAKPHSAREVVAVSPQDGFEMALALGREALATFPAAQGLLLAGGAWLSLPVISLLEAEFKKPVITNPAATCWMALRQFGLQPARPRLGKLFDSLTPLSRGG